MDICIGWPGKVYDARAFSNSTLFKKGTQGTLFPDYNKQISRVKVVLFYLIKLC